MSALAGLQIELGGDQFLDPTSQRAGLVLLGNVQVRTDTNVLVGSGEVIVQSVSP